MNVKKLIILQVIGVILFTMLTLLLVRLDAFTPTNEILAFILLGIGNVVNARNKLMKPIEELSIHDKLTGCYNRTKLDLKIPEYENYAEYAVIFFDLNNLKKMNDIHGHDDGDQLLIDASNQLRHWHEHGDLYRIGGDEFLVVVPNAHEAELSKTVEDWYNKQPALNTEFGDDFVCDFSYGICCKTKSEPLSFEEIMNRADENMYLMKKKRH